MKDIAHFFPLPDTPMTAGEAERFARKMYRFMVGETFAGTVYITAGIHGLGRKGFYARYKVDELQLLAATLEKLEP